MIFVLTQKHRNKKLFIIDIDVNTTSSFFYIERLSDSFFHSNFNNFFVSNFIINQKQENFFREKERIFFL